MKRKRRIRYRILALAIAVITCLNLFSEPLVVLAETENGGSLSNELTIDQSDEWIVVLPGEKATLHVGVMADNLEIVTYKWVNNTVPDGEGNYHSEPIEGATGDTYVTNGITEPSTFTCTINNGFGAEWHKYFYVDVENHLSVSADETHKTVDLGEKATLEVAVSAYDESKITYQWYTYDEVNYDQIIPGATGSVFETEEIQEAKQYYCIVKDGYGRMMRV